MKLELDAAVPPGSVRIPGHFQYQACDDRQCFIPRTIDTSWTREGWGAKVIDRLSNDLRTAHPHERHDAVAVGIEAVSEYLDETRGSESTTLIGVTAAERAETRRLIAWFDGKFHAEVSGPVLTEKVIRRFLPREAGGGAPDMARVRRGLAMVRQHLDYIGELADTRNWLAGERLTAADLAAAAHLSALDYLGDVPWQDNAPAKAWYQRIKCRPSFRPLLADHIRGMPPPRLYADLDF